MNAGAPLVHRDGTQRLLAAAGLSMERLPMLGVVLDRFADALSENLRPLATVAPHVRVESAGSTRIDAVLSDGPPAVVGIFHSPAWDQRMMAGLDAGLATCWVETILGGDNTEPVDGQRPLSPTEIAAARELFRQIGTAFGAALAGIAAPGFVLDRVETRRDMAQVGWAHAAVLRARLSMRLFDRPFGFFLAIPHAVLHPLRPALESEAARQARSADEPWRRRIGERVAGTAVRLEASLSETRFTLADIAAFTPGQTILLDAGPATPVDLLAGSALVARCALGQAEGRYRLEIVDGPAA